MKLINDNLKKAGYFNAFLTVIAIVLRIFQIVSAPIYVKIEAVICIIALVFGLFYSLNGYKKDAAKYYKAFIYLYLISSLFALIGPIFAILGERNILMIISRALVFIAMLVLAFVKDLGENKSSKLALAIFVINVATLCYGVTSKAIPFIIMHLGNVALSCILCVFVSAKYTDKASRGAK